jgi:DNA-binding HxlR family transcriptional regulator
MTYSPNFCPEFHRAVELIGKRWSGAIVREMMEGATRFSELRSAIPDISDRMLCARLKALENEAIVERRVFAETPVRVEYQLTEKGRALKRVFAAIGAWADEWARCPQGSAKASETGPEAA